MTTVKIKDLEIFANHGVLKEENVLGQKFIVSVELDIYTNGADDIDRTVDYAQVCEFCGEFLQKKTYRLIETAANMLAKRIMVRFPRVQRAAVEIKKPWAPIKMNLGFVSARAEAAWNKAHISLGSNLGDRRQHLNRAIEQINDSAFCSVLKISEFIETKPVGEVEQNDFLNGCIEIETLYEPFELLSFLHKIEDADGRTRDVHWGPRTIDLDIIFYGDEVISFGGLTVPHAEMTKREFVLKPLCEIAPYKKHPVCSLTVSELLEALNGCRGIK